MSASWTADGAREDDVLAVTPRYALRRGTRVVGLLDEAADVDEIVTALTAGPGRQSPSAPILPGDLPAATAAGAEPGSAGERWSWSTDEEQWSGDGKEYDTRGEAIEAALDELGSDSDSAWFWTGARRDPDLDDIARRVVRRIDLAESIGEILADNGQGGEWNDSWPLALEKHERDAVAALLGPPLAAWLREHRPPAWWTVTKVQGHDRAEILAERAERSSEGSRPA